MDSRRRNIIKSSVRSSINKLLDSAWRAYRAGKKDRSRRYVDMAFDLVRKHKVKMPSELRNSFCRKCHLVWIPGESVSVAYDRKSNCLRVTCECGHSKRL